MRAVSDAPDPSEARAPRWPSLTGSAATVLAALLYVLLAVAFTWPMALHLASRIPDGIDSPGLLWFPWWGRVAFAQPGLDLLHSPVLGHPLGVSLVSSDALLYRIVAPVLCGLWGPMAGNNLFTLASLAWAAFAMHLLALDLVRVRWIAFTAGATYAFNCHSVNALLEGACHHTATGWLPLFLLFLLRTADRPGWRNVLGAALCLGLTVLSGWYLALTAAVFAGLFAIHALTAGRGAAPDRPAFLRLAAIAPVAILLLAPVFAALGGWQGLGEARAFVAESHGGDPAVLAERLRAIATLDSPSLRDVLLPAGDAGGPPRSAYVGWLLAAVGLVGLAASGRRRAVWIAFLGVFAVLMLGPTLKLAGNGDVPGSLRMTTLTLPYGWLARALPFLANFQFPGRFVLAAILALAAGAAWGLDRIRSGRRGRWLAPLLAAGLLAEALVLGSRPWFRPMAPFDPPAHGLAIAAEEGDFAVLDVVGADDPSVAEQAKSCQTVHGKRILHAGHVRGSVDMQMLVTDHLRHEIGRQDASPAGRFRDMLDRMNVRFLVLHPWSFPSPDEAARWAGWLDREFGLPAVHPYRPNVDRQTLDAGVRVYRITTAPPHPVRLRNPAAVAADVRRGMAAGEPAEAVLQRVLDALEPDDRPSSVLRGPPSRVSL